MAPATTTTRPRPRVRCGQGRVVHSLHIGLLAAILSGCGTTWKTAGGPDTDADGDGYTPAEGDCWDLPGPVVIDGERFALDGAQVHPGAEDAPYDGLDADCAGDEDFDADGDGFVPAEYLAAPIRNNPGFDLEARPARPDCADAADQFTADRGHAPVGGAALPDPAQVFPGAPDDAFYDGVDADCAGGDDFDQDGDGHPSADHPQADGRVGEDCDDSDSRISPDADEVCDDVDNDCDSLTDGDDPDFDTATLRTWYADTDGDGHGDPATETQACSSLDGHVALDDDCDDSRADVSPSADERCDPDDTDEDCDGRADDADDSTLATGMTDVWADADRDGHGDPEGGARFCDVPDDGSWVENSDDCNDSDGLISPDATEICDDADIDENCNDLADDADPTVLSTTQQPHFADADGDGWGDDDTSLLRCDPGGGYVLPAGDCDDTAAGVNPGATEVCDAADTDEDCDGLADDADDSVDPASQLAYHLDTDGDGYGASGGTAVAFCDGDAPAGRVTDDTDCDDSDAAVHPGATEVCDAADTDEDCDGAADDDDSSVDPATQSTRYVDSDGDGYGDASDPGTGYCDPPATVVSDNTDCDDSDAAISPAATELCDAADTDEDCNGLADGADSGVDPGSQLRFYDDADGDGYGDLDDSGALYCDGEAPSGTVADHTDCDDGDAAISPGATEVCDGDDTDENCDGLADDDDPAVDPATQTTHHADSDGDGYGDASDPGTGYCDPPGGVVTDNTDCDDLRDDVNPGATEVCDDDDTDENCDGLADDADPALDLSTQTDHFADADGDGYGDDAGLATGFCSGDAPSGYVDNADDCDDSAPGSNPGATEICDAADTDEDCDGDADDDDSSVDPATQLAHYADDDGDGYGDAADSAALYCPGDAPAGEVADNTDCDDGDAAISPAATEVCDADDTDEDCDGAVDDADPSLDLSTRSTHYTDADLDGHGDPASPVLACDPTAGVSADADDCDDSNGLVFPEAGETCNDGLDTDCDGDGLTETTGATTTDVCVPVDEKLREGSRLTLTDAAGGGLGWALAAADLDGSADGVPELVIGAPTTSADSFSSNGGIWLLPTFDGESWDGDTATATALDSTATTGNGALWVGDEDDAWAGHRLATGDVDNDGFVDLLVAMPGAGRNGSGTNPTGAVFLVSGPITAFSGTGSLDSMATARADGTTVHGLAGSALAVGGDADGDGNTGDMLIGGMACMDTMPSPDDTNSYAGKIYAYGGGPGAFPSSIETATADFYWQGTACGGWALAWWDSDGDGTESAVMSEPTSGNEGRFYVDDVGSSGGSLALSNVDFIKGPKKDALVGHSFAVGDIDGDGTDDLLVPVEDHDKSKAAVYLLRGSSSFAYTSGAKIDAIAAAALQDDTANTLLGSSISVIGDLDGDGAVDLLLGAADDSNSKGAARVVYGPLSGTLTTATADTVEWTGEGGSEAGRAVLGAHDLNADGLLDMVIGAPFDDEAASAAGRVFIKPGLGL